MRKHDWLVILIMVASVTIEACATVVIVVAGLAQTVSCVPAKAIGSRLNDIARALCEATLAKPEAAQALAATRARYTNLSVQDLCAIDAVLAPFVDGLTKAKRSAVMRLQEPDAPTE